MPDIKPLVFIHGLFGSLSDKSLLNQYGELSVLAPDLLGYGKYRMHDVKSLTLVEQAEHVLSYMDKNNIHKANLIGHSVGGAVAALLAIRHPDRVSALVSVEGNMTPPDAFWSASLAQKSVEEIQQIVDGYCANVAKWISEAGVQTNTETIRIATEWLNHQPASTLKAQAHAVVEATSKNSGFLDSFREQLAMGLVLHMVSGSNSREGWHVPQDIEESATTVTVIRDSGHLMMLQSPSKFANVVMDALK